MKEGEGEGDGSEISIEWEGCLRGHERRRGTQWVRVERIKKGIRLILLRGVISKKAVEKGGDG
jgi:hypothetical protein